MTANVREADEDGADNDGKREVSKPSHVALLKVRRGSMRRRRARPMSPRRTRGSHPTYEPVGSCEGYATPEYLGMSSGLGKVISVTECWRDLGLRICRCRSRRQRIRFR